MPATCSFDVTSTVDLQEVDNALNQARKEVVQRYDFKGSKPDIQFSRTDNTITLVADDEFKMTALWEIVQGRMIKRQVPVKNLKLGEIERAGGDTVRRVITLQQGIPSDASRAIVKFIKDRKLKRVQAFCSYRFAVTYQYMADEIRWNMVGIEELIGREAVIDSCDKSAKFLETLSATITKLKINRAETFVVVEGAAQFQDQENQTSRVASCDVFQFSDGRLVEITSYVIELNKP